MVQKGLKKEEKDDITTAKICRNNCRDRDDQQGSRRTFCFTAKSYQSPKGTGKRDADHDL